MGGCASLGDESGVILALGKFHLVEDKLSSEGSLGLGILFLLEHTHLTCKFLGTEWLILMAGEILCLLAPLTLGRTIKVKCEDAQSGDPKEIVYWDEKGQKIEIGLGGFKMALNEGAEEMAAYSGEVEATASEEIELMD